jgi:cyclophilin family peptidyl-prolyl cis-trans isomerase
MPTGSRKTRDRQLAKLAERRRQERLRKRRQRILATAIGVAVAVGGMGYGLFALTRGGGTETAASPTPTPTPTSSVSPSPAAVACGGQVPAAASKQKPTFDQAPELTLDQNKHYTATIVTSCGTIELELFAREAPIAVNNFVFLTKKRFYNGLIFHRVVKDFVDQGGDPEGTGSGGPGYQFKDELDNDLTYEPGTLAMANSGPDTNGSQFFIVASENGAQQLEKLYTIFGKVTKGLDVVQTINNLPTSDASLPLETVYIEKITIQTSD